MRARGERIGAVVELDVLQWGPPVPTANGAGDRRQSYCLLRRRSPNFAPCYCFSNTPTSVAVCPFAFVPFVVIVNTFPSADTTR